MALLDEIRRHIKNPNCRPEHNAEEKVYAKLAAEFVQEIHDVLDEQVKEAKLDRREAMDIFWAMVRDIQMKSRNRGRNETETAEGEELAERTCEDEDECGANENE